VIANTKSQIVLVQSGSCNTQDNIEQSKYLKNKVDWNLVKQLLGKNSVLLNAITQAICSQFAKKLLVVANNLVRHFKINKSTKTYSICHLYTCKLKCKKKNLKKLGNIPPFICTVIRHLFDIFQANSRPTTDNWFIKTIQLNWKLWKLHLNFLELFFMICDFLFTRALPES
jgi:hypothetical protein